MRILLLAAICGCIVSVPVGCSPETIEAIAKGTTEGALYPDQGRSTSPKERQRLEACAKADRYYRDARYHNKRCGQYGDTVACVKGGIADIDYEKYRAKCQSY